MEVTLTLRTNVRFNSIWYNANVVFLVSRGQKVIMRNVHLTLEQREQIQIGLYAGYQKGKLLKLLVKILVP